MILICTWAICLSINSHNYCASWLQSSRFCLTKKRLFLRCFFVKEYENAVFHISMRPLSFTFENGVCRRPSMDAAFRYFTLKSKSRNFKSNSWLETWDVHWYKIDFIISYFCCKINGLKFRICWKSIGMQFTGIWLASLQCIIKYLSDVKNKFFVFAILHYRINSVSGTISFHGYFSWFNAKCDLFLWLEKALRMQSI